MGASKALNPPPYNSEGFLAREEGFLVLLCILDVQRALFLVVKVVFSAINQPFALERLCSMKISVKCASKIFS